MNLFDPLDPRPIHFMGIAGAGMSALALIARRRGVAVSGCDLDPNAAPDLADAGVPVIEGHDAGHLPGARAVVRSSAIPLDHPELGAASEQGLPIVRRAEALGHLVNGKRLIGVAGTHGKTTTTAMIADSLEAAGLSPTGIVGGRVAGWQGNARLGDSDLFVVEADEYDQSFLALQPTIAVINNVEADHLECYTDLNHLLESFAEFGRRADHVVISADDPGAQEVGRRLSGKVTRVGFAADADVRIEEMRREKDSTRALVVADGWRGVVTLAVPGVHNLRNAVMAIAAAREVGADLDTVEGALGRFVGVGRRFDVLGDRGGVTVVDDYAHHASEVAATIEAARQRFPDRNIVAVFQPHLFSRTRDQAVALGRALAEADRCIVTAIYAAREAPIPGVTGLLVAESARAAGADVLWVEQRGELVAAVQDATEAGDVALMLGAGDITHAAAELAGRAA